MPIRDIVLQHIDIVGPVWVDDMDSVWVIQ